MSGATYRDAGVDIEAGNRAVRLMKAAVEATHGPAVLGGVGAFGGLFDLGGVLGRVARPVLVASTDGVGTKIRVAAAVGRWSTVGADLVNHCIDDILVQGARPLFFLDYVASARLQPEQIATIVGGVAAACGEAGIALLGGETAEMPGVYVPGEIDLCGTIVGIVDREQLVDGSRIEVGDFVLGLGSTGLHTNGYSLARRVVQGHDLEAARESLGGASLADALLAVHRSYAPDFERLRADGPDGDPVDVRGMVHVTGGGLIDNPPRVLPDGAAFWLDESRWIAPPIFDWLGREGGIARAEQRHAFNCGLGLLVVVPEHDADRALARIAARSGAPSAGVVGRIVARDGGAPVRFAADEASR